MKPRTLFQKIWDNHVILQEKYTPAILYIDTHFIHEVTSPQAFAILKNKKLSVRRPDKTFATCDHNVSTTNQYTIYDSLSNLQVAILIKNCKDFEIPVYGLDSPYQGIVHIIGPEL